MLRTLAPILIFSLCFAPCRAGMLIRPDSRDLVLELDRMILPAFTCEGLTPAQAFAQWKEAVDTVRPVNMILREKQGAESPPVTIDLRGLSAFHVLKLLADRTGARIEFTRNVLDVRFP